MRLKFLLIMGLILAVALLAACAQSPEQPPAPEPATTPVECPDCPDCPEPPPCPECPEPEPCPEAAVAQVPFEEQWANSPHNDAESEAFRHWDEDDPPAVPGTCAKCHSEPGYLDFLGADGSEAGVVDAETVPIGTTVTCVTCHNDVTIQKTSVVFPSGLEITDLGDESRCMECHQGRESKIRVIPWDERLSTAAAERALLEADMSRAGRRRRLDKVAAAFILQGYLDYRNRKEATENRGR